MAGADYVECNVMFDEQEDGYTTALPPPHLLADDDDVEGEEFSCKIQIIKRSIPAMMSLDNTDIHYEKPKSDDDMANEEDLITSEMNIIMGRKHQEEEDEVIDLSKLLMSFTTFLKREKLEGAANIPASQDYKREICLSRSWSSS
nr:hypothetical protein Iba_chr02fCG2880 [Ipomoea batatas]